MDSKYRERHWVERIECQILAENNFLLWVRTCCSRVFFLLFVRMFSMSLSTMTRENQKKWNEITSFGVEMKQKLLCLFYRVPVWTCIRSIHSNSFETFKKMKPQKKWFSNDECKNCTQQNMPMATKTPTMRDFFSLLPFLLQIATAEKEQ